MKPKQLVGKRKEFLDRKEKRESTQKCCCSAARESVFSKMDIELGKM